jgi:hypothetical protein
VRRAGRKVEIFLAPLFQMVQRGFCCASLLGFAISLDASASGA